MAVIPVALGARSYEVHVAHGLLSNAGRLAAPYLRKARVPVIADENAWAAHGPQLATALESHGHAVSLYQVPPGEGAKSWGMLEQVTDWLLGRRGRTRRSRPGPRRGCHR